MSRAPGLSGLKTAPTGDFSASPSNLQISELSAIGAVVAVISIVGGRRTYAITLPGNGGGKFSINDLGNNTAQLLVAGALDFETQPEIGITVSATNGGPALTWSPKVKVQDAAESSLAFNLAASSQYIPLLEDI